MTPPCFRAGACRPTLGNSLYKQRSDWLMTRITAPLFQDMHNSKGRIPPGVMGAAIVDMWQAATQMPNINIPVPTSPAAESSAAAELLAPDPESLAPIAEPIHAARPSTAADAKDMMDVDNAAEDAMVTYPIVPLPDQHPSITPRSANTPHLSLREPRPTEDILHLIANDIICVGLVADQVGSSCVHDGCNDADCNLNLGLPPLSGHRRCLCCRRSEDQQGQPVLLPLPSVQEALRAG